MPTRILLILLFLLQFCYGQDIAVLKYGGGGDWYSNPSALKNLAAFCNKELQTSLSLSPKVVTPSSTDIFEYPFLHMTGHGNVLFSDQDVENLRAYLNSGGFLHIDDNYGMDKFVRSEMKKVFPNLDFIELPYNHPIYNQKYKFENGLPKIHEHDGKSSKGLALIYQGDLVCFYSYESDLGDGWEDEIVHNNSKETREKALKMGANILSYIFSNQKQ